jgi:NAD-dependent SIR2 family protein deacetylase
MRRREDFITARIKEYWQGVFGWRDGEPMPSLEDHFTQIDLAANSGHTLGHSYGPKKLRAIRRMTIHRVFKLLDEHSNLVPSLDEFFSSLIEHFDLTVVTTNWDILAERCLERRGRFKYLIGERYLSGRPDLMAGISILKLHGSANWGYCECCRNLITPELGLGKIAINFQLLLEPDDFRLFPGGEDVARDIEGVDLRRCPVCGGRWSVRVATFSYRKDLSVAAFQAIWDEALSSLRQANRWLFVGYSMPQADIEIRHLLKTAQLARMDPDQLSIEVVLKDCPAASENYRRFFGLPEQALFQKGLDDWISNRLSTFSLR